MTIILFLIDSSASMAQKTYLGTTMLDIARSIVELFLKQRVRDANARGDRYMLMSFEEFPANVKCGWRESQSIFQEQLKSLKPHGLTTFGAALGSAFRFVNVNRLQTGIDNYGCGRYPFYMEPVVIISITDGNSLTCPSGGILGEIKVAKPVAIGNELTEEPFRWDQRLFALVLRLSGHTPKARFISGMTLPPDNSPIDAMCLATGGMIENSEAKRNGEIDGLKPVADEDWRNILTTIYSRASRPYPGFWPIPESFWPDKNMVSLPSRKAHPVIAFRCEPCEPLVCQDFPFDKYELEPSALTQFILDRKQSSVCWQVYVLNSSNGGTFPAPFGYLKAATNLQCVNLFIMPYNYPVLLSLIDEVKQDSKVKLSQLWRLKLEKYLMNVPNYYIQPLKKAFVRLNITSPLLEPDQIPQYSYNILSYLTKIKHVAREEFDSHCSALATALQKPPVLHTQTPLVKRTIRSQTIFNHRRIPRLISNENFQGMQISVSEPKILIAPSAQFRNPFEIKRKRLVECLAKMRLNLLQQLASGAIPVFEGGRPGMNLKLQHAEDLHSLPVGQMGNYQEYVKSLEAVGRGALREVEPQAIRVHAFGNPFKIDKKNMAVDEVGEGSLLGGAGKADSLKKRLAATTSASVINSETSRPPRKKPGPLAHDSLKQWRRKRKALSMCSSSSIASYDSDIASVSSLKDDLHADISREKIISLQKEELNELCFDDQSLCLRHAIREARRFKRKAIVDSLSEYLNRFSDS
ncbi:unnamed protein product [Dracunculus medinensis]|uniref:VWFA domain-containing protein n=1 Tax=Dracunculus medinensis TaxID=318479 RepID=A0A158Q4F6_DRAME|nr:unnamed protein product [Dracunculus medinensis]